MGAEATPSAAERDFLAVCVALTGFDAAELEGTGLLEVYLEQFLAVAGAELAGRFVAAGARCVRAGAEGEVRAALQRELLDDGCHGPLARALIALWYTGIWYQLPREWRERHGASAADETRFLSARSYRAGLVWSAAGTHPISARPTGFGSWSLPPNPTGGEVAS